MFFLIINQIQHNKNADIIVSASTSTKTRA